MALNFNSQYQFPLSQFKDLKPLYENLSDKKIVLLGEASHGTHEFYTYRSEISKQLIKTKKFKFVAVEGDWPDCYRINRFIKGYPDSGGSAVEVLSQFNRWPTWMWANQETVDFVTWLYQYNQSLPFDERVGFYGLDVYSLWESLYEIVAYLKDHDPKAIKTAAEAYLCLEPFNEDVQKYAQATLLVPHSCEDQVVELLKDVLNSHPKYPDDPEAKFNAEQNAYVLKNGEEYYRTMILGGVDSWNLRDSHMMATLNRLKGFFGSISSGIVWAHNTHVGDAHFTDMASEGMTNLGQMAREDWGEEKVGILGFATYQGSVIAGSYWDAPWQKMAVPKAKDSSWEKFLQPHGNSLYLFWDKSILGKQFLESNMGLRAIGVVYNNQNELGNYVPTKLGQRFDSLIFLEKTSALKPLYTPPNVMEIPETYPWNL